MSDGRQTKKQNLDLALIGNSCAAAFVDQNARIVWWCFPHFDSDPGVFAAVGRRRGERILRRHARESGRDES